MFLSSALPSKCYPFLRVPTETVAIFDPGTHRNQKVLVHIYGQLCHCSIRKQLTVTYPSHGGAMHPAAAVQPSLEDWQLVGYGYRRPESSQWHSLLLPFLTPPLGRTRIPLIMAQRYATSETHDLASVSLRDQ